MESEKKEEKLAMPKYFKHKIEICKQKFKTHFLNNMQDLSKLKQTIINLSMNSSLQPEFIRPTAWKIFLKTLTFDINGTLKKWLEETYDKRNEFRKKLNQFKEEIEKAKTESPTNISNYEENSAIMHLITIDVERTYGDIKLFQDKYIRCKDPDKYLNEIYEYLHDEDEFQSDLYFLMRNAMKLGLNKFYDDSISPDSPKDDQKTYLLIRCDNILLKLKKHNNQLYQHFMDIQLSSEIILQRWLKCIFTREFTTEDCIIMWDDILANEFNVPSKNLEYIDYFCVAMFDYISDQLINLDQNECFLCLFKYPPFQTIDLLIKRAELVKSNILRIDAPKESIFSNLKSKFKDTINNINMPAIFNRNKIDDEQKKENILNELKKLPDNKSRIRQLKTILSKYRNKFHDDDRMKIDMLLNSLEKNV